MFVCALIVAMVGAAPAVLAAKPATEADDAADSNDFRACNGLSGDPEGSLAKSATWTYLGGQPVAITTDTDVPAGAQVTVTITWETDDFASLDQLFDCVFVDADEDTSGPEDDELVSALSDKQKPPLNTGSYSHTYTVPDDAAGKQVCDRARLSGTPNDPPNVSTQKSNTLCFDAVAPGAVAPVAAVAPVYRCDGPSVDEPDATLRGYSNDDAATGATFRLARAGDDPVVTQHAAAAASGVDGGWSVTVTDLLPGAYSYDIEFSNGEVADGEGCAFEIAGGSTPAPIPSSYACVAPTVDGSAATLRGTTDDVDVSSATFELTTGDTTTSHAGAAGTGGAWSATVTDLPAGDYTYEIVFADGDATTSVAGDDACGFSIAEAAPDPATPPKSYACVAPTVDGDAATLRASTDDAEVDGVTFALTRGDVTTDHAGSAGGAGDAGAWSAALSDLPAGDYTYEAEFNADGASRAAHGNAGVCRFTIAASAAAAAPPARTYTCSAPTVAGSSATLRGETDDDGVDGAVFHLTRGGVTTTHPGSEQGNSGRWSVGASDLAAGGYSYAVEFTRVGATVATASDADTCAFSVAQAPAAGGTGGTGGAPEYRCDPASGITQTAAVLRGTSTSPATTSATFTLRQGSTVVATLTDDNDTDGFWVQAVALQPGTAYSYTVEFDPGNHQQNGAACAFTSDAAAPLGSLQITTTAQGGDGTFTYLVDCDGTQFDMTLPVTTALGAGASNRITGIPVGTVCSVLAQIGTDWVGIGPALQTKTIAGDDTFAFSNRRVVTLGSPTTASLSVNKVDSKDAVAVGEAFEYIVAVRNDGPAGATGVVLSDVLPESLTVQGASASQGSCQVAGLVATCALGDIAAGDTAEVRLTVVPTAVGTLTNTALAAAQQSGPQTSGNGDVETTLVTAVQVLSAGSDRPAAQGATGSGGASGGTSAAPAAGSGAGGTGGDDQGQVGGSSLAATGFVVGLLAVIGLLLVAVGVTLRRAGPTRGGPAHPRLL